MFDDGVPAPLGNYISVKHGYAFDGQYFGEEPTSYVLVTPGNFAIGGGFQDGKAKYYNGPIPADYVLKGGELIVTMTDLSKAGDTLGYPALVPTASNPIYLHNQRIGLVSVTEPELLDAEYLYYLLRTDGYRHHVLATATGSTVRHTSPIRIYDYPVQLPQIGEQKRIAKVLRSLDDKIDQNRRTSEALERLARATFKSWFVDFEPVRAKADGAKSFPGMPPEAFAALPTTFAASTLGPIPEGWEVSTIGEQATVKGGATPSTKELAFWEGGSHCWVTPKDLSGLGQPILLNTDRRITDAGAAQISSGVLPIDTVLMSSRAPIGYLVLAKVPTAINQGFIALICDKGLPPLFVFHWLGDSLEGVKGRASGTTFPEISKAAFRPIPLVVPDGAVSAAYQTVITPLFDLITANVRESAKLAEVRDYLLPRLLSGAVRVRETANG